MNSSARIETAKILLRMMGLDNCVKQCKRHSLSTVEICAIIELRADFLGDLTYSELKTVVMSFSN